MILFAIAALLALTAVAYWDEIRDFVIDRATSWVRDHLGASAADKLSRVVVALDKIATGVRRGAKKIKMAIYAQAGGRKRHLVSEEMISVDDLPSELQETLETEQVVHEYDLDA